MEGAETSSLTLNHSFSFTDPSVWFAVVIFQAGQRWSQPHFDINELRQACQEQRYAVDDQGTTFISPQEAMNVILPANADPNYLRREPNGYFRAADMLDDDALVTIQQLYPASRWQELAQGLGLSSDQIAAIEADFSSKAANWNPVLVTLQVWLRQNDCPLHVLRDTLRDLDHPGCAAFVQRLWEGP